MKSATARSRHYTEKHETPARIASSPGFRVGGAAAVLASQRGAGFPACLSDRQAGKPAPQFTRRSARRFESLPKPRIRCLRFLHIDQAIAVGIDAFEILRAAQELARGDIAIAIAIHLANP